MSNDKSSAKQLGNILESVVMIGNKAKQTKREWTDEHGSKHSKWVTLTKPNADGEEKPVYNDLQVKLQFEGIWDEQDWLDTNTGQVGSILGSDLLVIAQSWSKDVGRECKLQVQADTVYYVQQNVDKITKKVVSLNPFKSKTGEEFSYVTLVGREPLIAGKAGF
tara:strand:- start:228 stop:719 length:492 start_codon:yes stop_codon:yes gene_type:complete